VVASGVQKVEIATSVGDVCKEVAILAEQFGADLIVLGDTECAEAPAPKLKEKGVVDCVVRKFKGHLLVVF